MKRRRSVGLLHAAGSLLLCLAGANKDLTLSQRVCFEMDAEAIVCTSAYLSVVNATAEANLLVDCLCRAGLSRAGDLERQEPGKNWNGIRRVTWTKSDTDVLASLRAMCTRERTEKLRTEVRHSCR